MAGIVVNGEQRPLEGVPLHTNALDFLRACGLTGAKEGCAEGECGACSVLVARPAADGSDATEWTAINSCLVPAAALDGQEVVTAEGLGAPDDLHPVQHEMAVRGGSQCGYCTPGFVCSMAAEFYRAGRKATNGSAPGRPRRATTATTASTCTRSAATCAAAPATGRSWTPPTPSASRPPTTRSPPVVRRPRRPPYPPGCTTPRPQFIRPTDLQQALRILAEDPDATVVAGSTDWGVDVNLKGARAGLVVAVDRLDELRGWSVGDDRDPDRGGPHAQRDRAAAGRPAAAAGRALPAVRLAADPQRRHPRRQPRHRLADRRRAAGAARAGGERRPRLGRRERTVPLADVLHRLPRVGPRARRADHRGRRTSPGRRPRRRSTRSPSARSTTSAAWPSPSRSTSPTAR